MPEARHVVVVELHTDGFHDHGSAHVADTVARRIRAEFKDDRMVKSVRVETKRESWELT